jgi:hypothetical protein
VYLRNGFYTTVETIYGLVDSGADFPIAPMDMVEELKLDLSKAPVRSFSGTTGKLQTGKLANVSIIVLAENGDLAFERTSPCVFCETFKFAGGMLLGQDGFFSHFKTVFHQPDNYFEIEPWVETGRNTEDA